MTANPPSGPLRTLSPSRRTFLGGSALALAAWTLAGPAGAQNGPRPPVLFLHGNGDDATLWQTIIWRFETLGWPRDRLIAPNFTDPLARNDDQVAQNGRSSAEDQRAELATLIGQVREITGAEKIAIVAHGRGGLTLRHLLMNPAEAARVSHAVLCGVPNSGIFARESEPGSLFNGRGGYMRLLNASPLPVQTAFMTLRSDGYDKYAQPDGRFMGWPGVETGVDRDGPMLNGAENVLLGPLDHRELATHPSAFRQMARFITGVEPRRISIQRETDIVLDGLVTGNPGGLATNRPVGDATVEVYRVDPETGLRQGEALVQKITGPDGRWGPLRTRSDVALEFVVTTPGNPATHIYRAPFARSSLICHLRAARPLDRHDQRAGALMMMSRPRGLFGVPRDVVLLDGSVPRDVRPGIPSESILEARLPREASLDRPVIALFNEQRIVMRPWPIAERRVSVAEFT